MTKEERYIARILLKNRILAYNGQKFEDFFVEIMTKWNIEFQAVKAYGNIGDKKNDGFIRSTGTYYQVFAPEDIDNNKTISNAVRKLENDFKGLVKNWDDVCKIKNFYFVINDKYRGIAPPILQKVMELSKLDEFAEIEINVFGAKELEGVFDSLADAQIYDIVGVIPNQDMPLLEYEALQETVSYLMNTEVEDFGTDNLVVPDFDKKIEFNGLSQTVNNKLVNASYQEGELLKYFNENPGCNEILQKRFHTIYENSKNEIQESEEDYADRRFFYILSESCNKRTLPIVTSVLVLMAHYFISCDIFEEPK
jgi:hypothetical protein